MHLTQLFIPNKIDDMKQRTNEKSYRDKTELSRDLQRNLDLFLYHGSLSVSLGSFRIYSIRAVSEHHLPVLVRR